MKPYYQDEWVTIYHGDCREILPELPKVGLVLADPPYGEKQALWDNAKPPTDIWHSFYRLLNEGGVLYYFGFWQHADWVLTNAKGTGFVPRARIIWWFRTGMPRKVSYREDAETIWYFSKGEPSAFNIVADLEPYEDKNNYSRYNRLGKHPGTVWIASRVFHNHPENLGHPTQKPEGIISKIIRISSNTGDLILDPFLGSGTTCYCAEKLNRRCIGIEIEEKYCEIAANRCRQMVMDLRAVRGEK